VNAWLPTCFCARSLSTRGALGICVCLSLSSASLSRSRYLRLSLSLFQEPPVSPSVFSLFPCLCLSTVCVYAYVQHTHSHTHTHTRARTQTHTHTHTHLLRRRGAGHLGLWFRTLGHGQVLFSHVSRFSKRLLLTCSLSLFLTHCRSHFFFSSFRV
jgi:hypothetical protein